MKKQFKKGQHVTLLGHWDRKGTMTYRFVTVHSCGSKRMTLLDDESGECLGSNFTPYTELERVLTHGTSTTITETNEEVVRSLCLGFAGEYLANERNNLNECMRRNASNSGYCKAIQKDIAELHEPRVLPYADALREIRLA